MKKTLLLLFILSFLLLGTSTFPVGAQQSQLIAVSPASGSIKLNEEKIVTVEITSDSKISGFDLRFSSSEQIVITDFTDQLGLAAGFDPLNYKKVVESANTPQARVSYIFTTTAANLPSSIKLYVKIKGIKTGKGVLNIDANTSQIIDANGAPLRVNALSMNYDVSDTASSSGFVEESQIQTPNYNKDTAVVGIKVKLYGAQTNTTKHVKAIAVVVGRIGEGKYETLPSEFELSPNLDQTFSGTVAFPNFKDGNKFSVMLKADKYLLKRICNSTPSENKPGEYRCQNPELAIRSGETATFDFSAISLIPGDLGVSDGFINGYDLSIVRNNLFNNSQQSVNTADLNYDGKVDSEDLKIIKYSFENKQRKADQ